MNGNPFTSWPQRVIVSLLLVVAVAIGAHLTDALLTPLVPWLVSAVILMSVFALVLSWFRH
ncbi:MAG: hypothetical protein ACRDRX_22365 [Pseudonocardiaceae bacterium]